MHSRLEAIIYVTPREHRAGVCFGAEGKWRSAAHRSRYITSTINKQLLTINF